MVKSMWACGLLVFPYTVLWPRDHMVSYLSRFTRMPPFPPICPSLHPLVKPGLFVCALQGLRVPFGKTSIGDVVLFKRRGPSLWITERICFEAHSDTLFWPPKGFIPYHNATRVVVFFARNSGMVWIIGILTAWEHRGAGDLLFQIFHYHHTFLRSDTTLYSLLLVTMAFFLLFRLQTPHLSQNVDKDIT